VAKLCFTGLVEAGGVGIIMGIENTQLIDFSRRKKRRKRQNCGQLERNWNAGFSVFLPIFSRSKEDLKPSQ
jgi:hypothetical protein